MGNGDYRGKTSLAGAPGADVRNVGDYQENCGKGPYFGLGDIGTIFFGKDGKKVIVL